MERYGSVVLTPFNVDIRAPSKLKGRPSTIRIIVAGARSLRLHMNYALQLISDGTGRYYQLDPEVCSVYSTTLDGTRIDPDGTRHPQKFIAEVEYRKSRLTKAFFAKADPSRD